ncbi:MAG TPA: thioredoxin family protein [Xanthomonadales bacterium]
MTDPSKFTRLRKRRILEVAAVFVCGLLAYHVALQLGGQVVVDRAGMNMLEHQVQRLQEENNQLLEELFSPKPNYDPLARPGSLPYDGETDARAAVRGARERARQEGKFLMVTFGANWCPDCRNLHRHLNSDVVRSYTADRFLFVNVDVGKLNQNRDLAQELGVSLRLGIPVAIFFDPTGRVIGATNNGELEPARLYTSPQILKFVRDVTERSRILAPDAVR